MSIELSRRSALRAVGGSLGLIALRGYAVERASTVHFTHGVASGDPLSDRVILWSRAVPGGGRHTDMAARWEVAIDAQFANIVTAGVTATDKQRDYTLKVDATGLQPNTRYFYRFINKDGVSPVGQTRTLPLGDVDSFRLGIASCSNYPQGYFNAYADMAQTELDVVLHLGDYIYEYEEGEYADPVALKSLQRNVQPEHEIVSIEDYRMRYGLYRTDPDLQAVHARHPFICVWDDHELANDTWISGAENHDAQQGDFSKRAAAARQAYHEWMPIRTSPAGDQGPIFRNFAIGNLADLIMLDTRHHGRDQGLRYGSDMPLVSRTFDPATGAMVEATAEGVDAPGLMTIPVPFSMSAEGPIPITDFAKLQIIDPRALPEGWFYLPDAQAFMTKVLPDESRQLLGQDQEQWLAEQLKRSSERGATWQILGQQILMGKLNIPNIPTEQIDFQAMSAEVAEIVRGMQAIAPYGAPLNLDAWDGYPAARSRVLDAMRTLASNPISLAGDTHDSWTFNLADTQGRAVGIEFGVPGISSPGMGQELPIDVKLMADGLRAASGELVDLELTLPGWGELTLTPKQATSQWHYVDTVLSRDYQTSVSEPMVCKPGRRQFDTTG